MRQFWPFHACGAIIVLLVSAVAWAGVISPRLNSRAIYRQLVADLQERREALRQNQSAEQAVRDRLASLQQASRLQPLVLRALRDLNVQLQELTDMASRAGLQVNGVEAGQTDNYTRYSTVMIQVTGRGRGLDLQTFLRDLHQHLPDIDVIAAELSGRYGEGSPLPNLTMKLRWPTGRAIAVVSR